jgi:hypothetical protein
MSGKQKSAERAIEQFHSDFNAGNFRKIYQKSDDLVFKRGQLKIEWERSKSQKLSAPLPAATIEEQIFI